MDAHDRDNLEFLMSISEDALRDFLDQIDPDDLEYAQELLDQFSVELRARANELGFDIDVIMFEEDTDIPPGTTIH